MKGLYADDGRWMFQIPSKTKKVTVYTSTAKTLNELVLEKETKAIEIQSDGWNAYFSYDDVVSLSNFDERIIKDLPRNYSVQEVWENRTVSVIWDQNVTQIIIIQR